MHGNRNMDAAKSRKDDFIAAVRKFMEMETLTAPLLRELIEHIDVYETEGAGKNRTQRLAIYYRFVGYIELPTSASEFYDRNYHYKTSPRQDVEVEYIRNEAADEGFGLFGITKHYVVGNFAKR